MADTTIKGQRCKLTDPDFILAVLLYKLNIKGWHKKSVLKTFHANRDYAIKMHFLTFLKQFSAYKILGGKFRVIYKGKKLQIICTEMYFFNLQMIVWFKTQKLYMLDFQF